MAMLRSYATPAGVPAEDRLSRRAQQLLAGAAILGTASGLLGVGNVLVSARDAGAVAAGHVHQPAPATRPTPAGEHDVGTHFGRLVVHQPQVVQGLPAKALAGQVHGIQDFVPAGRERIQVPVTMLNQLDVPVHYDPSWFRLAIRRPKATREQLASPTSTTLHAGRLLPDAAIEGSVGFVVPRTGARIFLLVHEPGHREIRVPLGGSGTRYVPRPGDVVDHGPAHAGHDARGANR